MKEEKKLEGVSNIETDVVFNGIFRFKDTLILKGKINGSISGKEGKLVIEKEGMAEGKIEAKIFENHGFFQGDAVVEDFNLYSTGKIHGSIKTKKIMIEKGAIFNAHSQMVE